MINCLKNTGMPIKQIKKYIDYCFQGDATLNERLEIFRRQKESVEQQIHDLQVYLKRIEYKIWYYETAVAAGTEAVHRGEDCITKTNQIN